MVHEITEDYLKRAIAESLTKPAMFEDSNQQHIRDIMAMLPLDRVLITINKLNITVGELMTLAPKGLLCDNIINAYFQLIDYAIV